MHNDETDHVSITIKSGQIKPENSNESTNNGYLTCRCFWIKLLILVFSYTMGLFTANFVDNNILNNHIIIIIFIPFLIGFVEVNIIYLFIIISCNFKVKSVKDYFCLNIK